MMILVSNAFFKFINPAYLYPTAHGLDAHQPEPPLRPLTSLNWPYVPEQSAYPDPLKRDDPKMLQLHQYEAIGMIFKLRHL